MQLFFPRQKPKTNTTDAIVKLRDTLQMLEKRENHLQSKIDSELKIAKVNATSNKRAALMALKRKKQYESQIEKISGTRMTMETQMMAIESASVNLETIKAMEKGAEAMKTIHGSMDINKVDDTMDSIREQMDLADEISNAISAPMLGADLIDDDELTAELDELEQEVLDSQLLGAEAPPFIAPKVPKTELVIESEEDKELEELRAAMAL
ncbi:15439_t:CDS:2 [Entrophospora sp. SA101]|nr:9016_t:CDS:2 [Entrophospora candida]CAJ0834949.1 1819_t:CDS:2 [Entrophospora sp. SA101]CAJ0844787.1 15439_t:CDS:2 [Entrophospora sp. SA101]CAJ0850280.1 16845_t:CDS:2 [Entrophospora sp. SA101]